MPAERVNIGPKTGIPSWEYDFPIWEIVPFSRIATIIPIMRIVNFSCVDASIFNTHISLMVDIIFVHKTGIIIITCAVIIITEQSALLVCSGYIPNHQCWE